MWTHFFDMHSGGGLKEPYQSIMIEAPEAEARVVFYNRFGHNPDRVSCTCCGQDYSVSECDDPLEELGHYHTGESVLFIRSDDIRPEEREGTVPVQGYVWVP